MIDELMMKTSVYYLYLYDTCICVACRGGGPIDFLGSKRFDSHCFLVYYLWYTVSYLLKWFICTVREPLKISEDVIVPVQKVLIKYEYILVLYSYTRMGTAAYGIR